LVVSVGVTVVVSVVVTVVVTVVVSVEFVVVAVAVVDWYFVLQVLEEIEVGGPVCSVVLDQTPAEE
jgi:hypothetical protein